MTNTQMPIKARLFGGAATLLASLALAAAPAWGQQETDETNQEQAVSAVPQDDASPQAEAGEGGLIVVTGSRIARPDLTSTSPLAVVQDEEFKLSGAVNVEQVINTLPQVVPGTTAFSNNPGDGTATLDLRGLGATRTLVLVNGRRYLFFDTDQIVDLNTIPQFLIDGVDVVTGGASAVYGSDAIAGVVNFRLRNDIDGLLAGAQYSITGEGDGPRFDAHLALGTEFAEGRGHATVFAEYYTRSGIFAGARDFSQQALGDVGGELVPQGSPTTPQGRFAVPAVATVRNPIDLNGDGDTDDVGEGPVTRTLGAGNFGTSLGANFGSPGVSDVFDDPGDFYNYAPVNYLQVPQERWLMGGYADYEINEAITVFTEVTFINNRVQNELAATPVTGTLNIDLAANQQYLSAADFEALEQVDANETAINAERAANGLDPLFGPSAEPGTVQINAFRRVLETGARNALFERNAFRVLAGVTGELTDRLNYEAYYQYARTRNSNVQEGNVSRSAYNAAVQSGAINVFGPGTLTPDAVDQITILSQNGETSVLQVAQGTISGSLFNLGMDADDVGFAIGGEWRSVDAEFIPDTALSSGDVVGFNAGNPTEGGYQVREVFGELLVPIIADRPFFDSLELSGAVRYSDYTLDAVGGVVTWAAGGRWAPIPDLQFRGNYQRATRAPNVDDLFAGNSNGFPAAIDPCSEDALDQSTTVRNLCIATGVPAAAVFTNIAPASQIEAQFGGNPDLEEETSDTWSVGAVIQPRFLPGFNVTVDYFRIEVEDYISTFGGGLNNTLNLCYNVLQDIESEYCQAIVENPVTGLPARDPNSGIIGGQFVPFIGNANVASLETSGIDLQADYSIDLGFSLLGEGSRLNLFFLGTWTEEFIFTPVVDQPDIFTDCAGAFGTAVCGNPKPEFKWTSRASLITGPLTTSVRWRYLGPVTDDNEDVEYVVERLDPKHYIDLTFAYDVNERFSMAVGVNNLFDEEPQLIGSNQEQTNTYPGVYDVIGRDFFVSGTVRF